MGVGLVCLCCLLVVTAFTEQELCQFIYDQLPTKVTKRLDIVKKHVIPVHNKSHNE